jgi:LasA protease
VRQLGLSPTVAHTRPAALVGLLAIASLACNALAAPAEAVVPTSTLPPSLTPASPGTFAAPIATYQVPIAEAATHTPAPPQTPLPTTAAPPVEAPGNYTVQSGDTLEALALRFGTEPASIVLRNPGLADLGFALAQTLPPGMRLDLPLENVPANAFSRRLVPDSEVVYSPGAAGFDVAGFVLSQPGYLAAYSQVLAPGQPPTPGWQIVEQYARRYSINPRLLLALLEHQTGALSNPGTDPLVREHALGVYGPAMNAGLSHQLGWAGNQLNYGYYGWRAGSTRSFTLADGGYRAADGALNAGSFAVARLLGLVYGRDGFERAAAPDGLAATYQRLFGDPYSLAYEPLIPGGLLQPAMQLPFEPGRQWAFTGGPHSPYGRTLPWAALDFAPPAELHGCAESPEWVVAVRDGIIIYSADGLLELDVGEGWVVVHLHVAAQDRAPAGSLVRAGDRLGHPSCEGGEATGTHLHIARRYNGEWVPADGYAPFVLSGWRAHFGATTYRGTLSNGVRTIEANASGSGSTRLWIEQ